MSPAAQPAQKSNRARPVLARPTDPRLTPGGYMRDCRRRAKLTIAQVAERIAIRAHDRQYARLRIAELEQNRPGDYGPLITRLTGAAVFPFSLAHFASLAAETADHELDTFDQDFDK